MNILYLHRTQAKGVEGVHIGEIVKCWRRLGHHVDLLSPVRDQIGDAQLASAPAKSWLTQRLFRLISEKLPEFLFELAELGYNLITLSLARRLDKSKVDFIFERYAIFAISGAFLAKRWCRPFVVEVNYTSCSSLVRERSRLLKPLAKRLDRYIFTRATGLVAVSSYLKQHLIFEYGVAPERIVVLPNAADPEVFDMAKVNPPATLANFQGKIIGFVGGFYPWHGIDLLLQAFQLMAKRVPEARLLLIGDGPMLPAIRAQSVAMGLDERVILAGRVAHTDLPGYISLFHVGVMPDSNEYGSPMKIFEYMALGKPVVVPDYGPLLDAVVDGQEGRIFPAKNVQQMAECLTMLLTDNAAHARMSAEARKKILSKHNWLSNAEAILGMVSGGAT